MMLIGFILMLFMLVRYIRYIRYVIIPCIKVYLYAKDAIISILPTYIYIKTYNYKTIDLDYSIYEYWYKYNNKYYKFNAIEDNKYTFKNACKIYNPSYINLINHCCILSKDDEYIRDITNEIRYFMYYRGLIEWKYILTHLNIENDKNIMIYMNDLDLTEKKYKVSDIYNQKFNF